MTIDFLGASRDGHLATLRCAEMKRRKMVAAASHERRAAASALLAKAEIERRRLADEIRVAESALLPKKEPILKPVKENEWDRYYRHTEERNAFIRSLLEKLTCDEVDYAGATSNNDVIVRFKSGVSPENAVATVYGVVDGPKTLVILSENYPIYVQIAEL